MLRVQKYTDTQASATFGAREPQNRAPTPKGLLTFPAPANTFTRLCHAKESPQRWDHLFPQPSAGPQLSMCLCSCHQSHHYWMSDQPPAPTKLITSSGQSFQQRAENTIGLEKEKWELVDLQRLDGFVRLGTKSGFLLGKEERRGTFPTFILAPSGKAVMGLEENALLNKFPTASVEIPLGSLEACYRDLIH